MSGDRAIGDGEFTNVILDVVVVSVIGGCDIGRSDDDDDDNVVVVVVVDTVGNSGVDADVDSEVCCCCCCWGIIVVVDAVGSVGIVVSR